MSSVCNSLSAFLTAAISSLVILKYGDSASLNRPIQDTFAQVPSNPFVQDNLLTTQLSSNEHNHAQLHDQNSHHHSNLHNHRQLLSRSGSAMYQDQSRRTRETMTNNRLFDEDRFDQRSPFAEALLVEGNEIAMSTSHNFSVQLENFKVKPTIPIDGFFNQTSNVLASSTISTLISSSTTPSTTNDSYTQYATVNYNGLIGLNATDPYAITTESKSLSLPTEIQVSYS